MVKLLERISMDKLIDLKITIKAFKNLGFITPSYFYKFY